MRHPWILALILGVGLPAVGWTVQGSLPGLAIGLALLGSGAALTLLLVPEMSVLLWAGASVVAGLGVLLLHALLRVAIAWLGAQPYLPGLAGTSLLLGALGAFVLWRTRWPRVLCGFTRGDVVFLGVLVPVLASSLLVSSRNGYVVGPGGREEFHAHGFVNGDTMTLFALTNSQLPQLRHPSRRGRAATEGFAGQATPNSELVRRNPFAAGAPLEYPVLLHHALASLSDTLGFDVTRAVWWLILPVLAGTVALSVLSVRFVFRDQRVPPWSALVLLAAFGATWESFTYPQSHTFLTGLFLLFLLLLVRRDQSSVRGERSALRYASGVLAILLLFSNAVLGTAAVAIAVMGNLLQVANHRWPLRERISGLIGATILLFLFRLFPPGAGALGTLNVAYTAVPQFLTAALPALLVLWALWDTAWLHRSASLLGAAVVLPALALVTLTLSGRDIVAENSPRFLFLLALLGWTALIPLAQRVADWWWRQVRHVEHTLAEYAVLWSGAAFAVVVLLLPAFASVTGTLDMLVRKPPLAVSADELAAFAWIRTHTPPGAVFLRAPESLFENPTVSPLSLPAFTGRAQLRSEYWLSPEDAVLGDIRAFFAERGPLPQGAQYLFCGPEIERCPVVGSVVFSAGTTSVQKL